MVNTVRSFILMPAMTLHALQPCLFNESIWFDPVTHDSSLFDLTNTRKALSLHVDSWGSQTNPSQTHYKFKTQQPTT